MAQGRLFFVGDPKQSIYRFRRADVELFAEVGEQHAAAGPRLDVNFRSRSRRPRGGQRASSPTSSVAPAQARSPTPTW